MQIKHATNRHIFNLSQISENNIINGRLPFFTNKFQNDETCILMGAEYYLKKATKGQETD